MKKIKEKLTTGLNFWNRFWFKPADTISLSGLRFCVSLVLLVMYLVRFFDIRIFFYESGLLGPGSAQALRSHQTAQAFHFILSSDTTIYLCYMVFVFLLFLMVLGVGGRLVSFLTFVFHLLFMHTNPTIIYGADYLATFLLFYLMIGSSHRQLRWIPYFVHKRRGLVSEGTSLGCSLSTLSLRLIQIQLCVIYACSGFSLFQRGSSLQGTGLWEAFSHYEGFFASSSYLLMLPVFVVGLLFWFVLAFQLYFPVLVWFSLWRKPLLISGCVLHTVIALSQGFVFFSLLMLSCYVVFLKPESLRVFFQKFQKS